VFQRRTQKQLQLPSALSRPAVETAVMREPVWYLVMAISAEGCVWVLCAPGYGLLPLLSGFQVTGLVVVCVAAVMNWASNHLHSLRNFEILSSENWGTR
jgi:hypothetical protein